VPGWSTTSRKTSFYTQGVAALGAQLLERLFFFAAARVITLHEAARRALAAH